MFVPDDAPAADATQRQELQEVQQLQLVKPGDTRFASAFIMLERVLKLKLKLQQLVVSDRWATAIGKMKAADKVRITILAAALPPSTASQHVCGSYACACTSGWYHCLPDTIEHAATPMMCVQPRLLQADVQGCKCCTCGV